MALEPHTCIACGVEYYIFPLSLPRGQAEYCSAACAGAAKVARPFVRSRKERRREWEDLDERVG